MFVYKLVLIDIVSWLDRYQLCIIIVCFITILFLFLFILVIIYLLDYDVFYKRQETHTNVK